MLLIPSTTTTTTTDLVDMSYNPYSTLLNPYRQVTQVPQALPLGFNQGTNTGPKNGSFPIDTNITMAGSAHYGSGDADTNGRVSHHLFHNRNNWKDYHTGDAQLTFVKGNYNVKALDGSQPPDSVEHEMMGLSMMNYHLRYDPYWKQQFNQNSAREFCEQWAFFGVQQNDTPTYFDAAREARKQNFYFARQVFLPNIWAASQNVSGTNCREAASQLDDLYLILQRAEQPLDGEELLPARNVNGLNLNDSTTAVENYWRIVPYVSHDRLPPPACLYTNYDPRDSSRSWVGTYWRVGKVTGVIGSTNNNAVISQAREAIFPTTRSNDYKTPLYRLPQLEVFLKVS